MNVALFSNHFAQTEGHGIARYARSLHAALRGDDAQIRVMPVVTRRVCPAASLPDMQQFPGGPYLPPLMWTLFGGPALERGLSASPDVVHLLNLGYSVPTRCPLVVTIHDIGPLTHPAYFRNHSAQWMRVGFRRMMRRADAFVCVSQATADEVIAYAGADVSARIHVVHEGVAKAFLDAAEPDALRDVPGMPPSGTPFILAAGAMSPRKNLSALLAAVESLMDSIPQHLVLVGGAGWDSSPVLKQFSHSPVAKRIHHLGYVTDEVLRALYAEASVFAYVSQYEGFGLPVLEAMAAGCPVVTSNASSLPEVAGDAARLVDPYSVASISEGILSVCGDAGLAETMRHAGRKRASQFSWETCAKKQIEIYKSVAS